jgi:multicomponent Na+:H+ antiporter subunit E
LLVFVVSFLTYLLLCWSGHLTVQDLAVAFVVGAVVSLVFSGLGRPSFWSVKGLAGVPLKCWEFLRYVFGPFAVGLAQANIDVATRVITGEINPGIVKFNPRLKTDLGRMALANSITLTPGTLTVDVDDDGTFYVHAINLTSMTPAEEDICGPFGKCIRRIMG